MALFAKHNETKFGVGDTVRVLQKVKEGDKDRTQAFEGMVIGIKGRDENISFTVRKIGAQQIGIERIFPLKTPTIESVVIVKKGTKGVRRAKLYYTREKSKKEIDEIYARTTRRELAQTQPSKAKTKSSKAKK